MAFEEQPELFEIGVNPEALPGSVADAAFDAWNERAHNHNWAIARANTCGRPAKLRRAVKDVGGIEKWRKLLDLCGTSDFLCGRTQPRPFRFTLDWALKPANLLKLIERNYIPESERRAAERVGTVPNWSDDRIATAWRTRSTKPSVVIPFPTETAEERLRATVEMYRERGREADAQRVEAKLAALGKPQR